jgi:hypothetical protein
MGEEGVQGHCRRRRRLGRKNCARDNDVARRKQE